MKNAFIAASGFGVGAGLMYLLDPDRGNRRRAVVRDKAISAAHIAGDAAGVTARDLGHRSYGTVAALRGKLRSGATDDTKLVERVRSKLGRVVSHPHAVEVLAENGRITLRGPILTHEAGSAIKCAKRVRGVSSVEDQLERHKTAGNIPDLQGGRPRTGEPIDIMQTNWSPATRALAGMAGGALALFGAGRRDLVGAAMATAGLGLATRAATNTDLLRLTGMTSARNAVSIRKTINIAAPVEEVYGFWRDIENFPRWMSNVREVRVTGEGLSHWVVDGPAGVPVEWDAVVTREEPNKLLAWKSVEGSAVASSGMVRFKPSDRGTIVEVHLQYNPPAGAIGHGIATMLGSDPKTTIDQDLLRLKTTIETGAPPADAAEPPAPGAGTPSAPRSI